MHMHTCQPRLCTHANTNVRAHMHEHARACHHEHARTHTNHECVARAHTHVHMSATNVTRTRTKVHVSHECAARTHTAKHECTQARKHARTPALTVVEGLLFDSVHVRVGRVCGGVAVLVADGLRRLKRVRHHPVVQHLKQRAGTE